MSVDPKAQSILDQLPPEMRSKVMGDAGAIQKKAGRVISKMMQGKTVVKFVQQPHVPGVVDWLNANAGDIISYSVVNDFNTYGYFIIYEVADGD